jgi:AraC-like DNA-binding protein
MFVAPPAPPPDATEWHRPRRVQYVLPFAEAAELAGVELDALLAAIGLTRERLRDPAALAPYYQLHWLCEQLIDASGDPEIGLRAAERADFTQLEFAGHVVRHFIQVAPSLLHVLELLARFWTLVSRTAHTTLRVVDGRVVIRIVPTLAAPDELYDAAAGACCRLIEKLGGPSVRPLEVRLPRPRPQHPERFEHFFRARVAFDSDALELHYEAPAFSTDASEVAHALSAEAVAPPRSDPDSLAQQVRTRVLDALADGVPSLPELARKLGVSARTLRRRLGEARTGYSELVDQARRQRALALATRAELDVDGLAQLTGFADGSAFARAFRRWTGEAPSAYMQRARKRARTQPSS